MTLFGDTRWTPTAIDMLHAGAADGLSVSQLARRLSEHFGIDFSRNSVMGKVHRLGLPLARSQGRPLQDNPAPKAVRAKRIRIAARPRPSAPEPLPPIDEPAPLGDVDTGCRWLHGDDARARNFCGAEKREGSSYCEHHGRRYYRGVSPSRGRRREQTTEYVARRFG